MDEDSEDEVTINLRSEPDAIFSILTGFQDPTTSDIDIIIDESEDEGTDCSDLTKDEYNFLNAVGKFDFHVLTNKSSENLNNVGLLTLEEPEMNTENVRTAGNDSSVGEIIEPSFDLKLPVQGFAEADVSVFSILMLLLTNLKLGL